MNKMLGIFLAVAMLVGAVSAAQAHDFYVSGNVGLTSGSDNPFESDNTYGGGVAVGYNLASWLAAEAGYDYLGKEAGDVTQAYTGWAVIDPTLFSLGSMPVKGIARVGYTGVQTAGASELETGWAYGAGVGVGLSKSLDLVVDYRVRDLDTSELGNVDVSTAGVGVKYEF